MKNLSLRIFFCFFFLFYQFKSLEAKETHFELNLDFQKDNLKSKRGLKAEHYPITNEYRIDLFFSKIKDLNKGYLGVGTDQNFSLLIKARSEFAILMDFDPEVVIINKLHILILKQSRNYTEFKYFWDKKNIGVLKELIELKVPNEKEKFFRALKIAHQAYSGVPDRLNELEALEKKIKLETFSNKEEEFNYLKNLALENKIFAIEGDLNGKDSIQNLAKELRAKNLLISVFYLSNAEEYFPFYKKEFIENIKSIPTHGRSVILRTASTGTKSIFGFPDNEKYKNIPMHYNIQKISNFIKWLEMNKKFNSTWLLLHRTKIEKGFSEIENLPR